MAVILSNCRATGTYETLRLCSLHRTYEVTLIERGAIGYTKGSTSIVPGSISYMERRPSSLMMLMVGNGLDEGGVMTGR
jgi:hypothetical protein